MEHTILFETEKSTFHLWPLDYYGWRGFFSKSHVVVTEEDIMVEFKGIFKNTFRLDELEFCNVKKRWLGYANSQLSVGVNDREWHNSDKYKKEYEKLLKRERENEENSQRYKHESGHLRLPEKEKFCCVLYCGRTDVS